MIRIAIIGAGAVGGYFGGLMSLHYRNSQEVEIYFICKEATGNKIKDCGLLLETTHGNYEIYPNIFSEYSQRKFIFDFILCSTKSFDLIDSILPLKAHINEESVIVPLQNGVDSYDQIKSVYPDAEVWDACVYLVSQAMEAGHIKETGGLQLLYFGSRNHLSAKLMLFENILIKAGIKANYSDDILSTIWEKFLFISSIASSTSYTNKSIGEILENEKSISDFQKLLNELKTLAGAKNIKLPEDIFEKIYSKMRSLPFQAISSMHRDFRNKKRTELETLTGSVVKMARDAGIEVPEFSKIYIGLKALETKV